MSGVFASISREGLLYERSFSTMHGTFLSFVNLACMVAFKQELYLTEPTAKHAGAGKPLENSIGAR